MEKKDEMLLRSTVAMHKGCIEEINKLLVAAGKEPEPESIIKTTKAVANGLVATVGNKISAFGNMLSGQYEDVKKAGALRQAEKELERKLNEDIQNQMKALRDKLHASSAA